VELGRRLDLTERDRLVLADAGLLHHYPAELVSVETVGSALAIVYRQARVETPRAGAAARRQYLQDLVAVLTSFHSRSLNRPGGPLIALLAAAHFLVERLEATTTQGDPREALFDALRRKAAEGLIATVAFRACTNLPRPRREDLAQTVSRLPVFPAIALRVLALAASESVSIAELSALVSKDQVLAGHLIAAANSCLYSPTGKISAIGHAMSYVGLDETRRIITAASMRPLFASGGIAGLWKHSLEVARLCEDLAAATRVVRKDEAFLAGLVHDVGRLLAVKHSGEASLTFVRMVEQGCDPAFAETILFGCDHAGLGTEVLRVWKFPERLVDAVRRHHDPERSEGVLASLIYLTESRMPAEIAEPSPATLEYAAQRVGVSVEASGSAEPDLGLLQGMCS
jgi:putative nucleotidyltransferase with HDIG domain